MDQDESAIEKGSALVTQVLAQPTPLRTACIGVGLDFGLCTQTFLSFILLNQPPTVKQTFSKQIYKYVGASVALPNTINLFGRTVLSPFAAKLS